MPKHHPKRPTRATALRQLREIPPPAASARRASRRLTGSSPPRKPLPGSAARSRRSRPCRYWRAPLRHHRPRQEAPAQNVRRFRPRQFHRQPDPKGFPVSLYRDRRSPFWQYDFTWRGHRFFGSTKATTRREAEKVEAAEREKAKQYVAQTEAARTSMALDDVAGRYWNEVGQHHSGARNTWRELARLIQFFGKDKLLTEIAGNNVAKLVAWRRGHQVRGKLISPFTVNATTKQLRKLFTRATMW